MEATHSTQCIKTSVTDGSLHKKHVTGLSTEHYPATHSMTDPPIQQAMETKIIHAHKNLANSRLTPSVSQHVWQHSKCFPIDSKLSLSSDHKLFTFVHAWSCMSHAASSSILYGHAHAVKY